MFGESKHIGFPGGLLIYMNGQSKRMMELNQTLSQTQKSIIHESVKKNVERAANSASFEAMLHDIDMFGDDAFERGNQTGPPRHFFLSFLGFFIVTNYRTYALYLLSTTKATTHLVKRCEHVPKRFSFPPNAELAIRPSPPILMRWPWATRPVLMGETRVRSLQGEPQAERSSWTTSECTLAGAPRWNIPIERLMSAGTAAIDSATRPSLPKTSIEPRSRNT